MTKLFLRVYFSADSWIGPGKVQLLEAIRAEGSISAAARTMGMSYRRAWLLVESLNQLFKTPAVQTTLGGRGGGTATLTEFGTEIVTRYRAMETAARQAIAKDAAALERRLRTSSHAPAAKKSAAATIPQPRVRIRRRDRPARVER